MTRDQTIKSLTKSDLLPLIAGRSMNQVMDLLGYHKSDRIVRKLIYDRLVELGIHTRLGRRRHKSYTVEDLRRAVKEALCISDVIRSLGLAITTTNFRSINKDIQQNNISTSHFDPLLVRKRGANKSYELTSDGGIPQGISRTCVRPFVIRNNLLPYKCSGCEIDPIWCGRELTLQLDHINGDSTDHNLSNLRFLCPNCHSQTSTFCRRKN